MKPDKAKGVDWAEPLSAGIVDFLPDPAFAIDMRGNVVVWNKPIAHLTGVRAEDMIGQSDYAYSVPFYGIRRPMLIDMAIQWDEETAGLYNYVQREDGSVSAEAEDVKIRGNLYHLWATARRICNLRGTFCGAIEIIRDVTHMKRVEEALRKSEQRLAAIFSRAAVGLCEMTTDGRFTRVNDTYCQLLGRTRDQLLNLSLQEVTDPDEVGRVQHALRSVFEKGQLASLDKTYIRPDQTEVHANCSLTRIDDEQGQPLAVMAVTVDMTERVKAKAVLERRVAERTAELEARNREIRVLAHKTIQAMEDDRRVLSKELHDSIGGTLAAIRYQLEGRIEGMGVLQQSEVVPLEGIIEYLCEAISETRRITKQLRPSVLDDFGLLAAINDFVHDFQQFYPAQTVSTAISIREEDIPADIKTVLYRVLQEALNNAGRHSSAGSVHIQVRKMADTVQLRIRDDGVGFVPSEVFKQPLSISGYGLHSMRERVEICHGDFRIVSNPGEGTEITASIPLPPDGFHDHVGAKTTRDR